MKTKYFYSAESRHGTKNSHGFANDNAEAITDRPQTNDFINSKKKGGNMKVNYDQMCAWESKKAVYLQKIAVDLGMDLTGNGEVGVNESSGNTFLWLEEYNFCLFMPISCELIKNDVRASYACLFDGEETEIRLEEKTNLADLIKWSDKLLVESEKKLETFNFN